jgi:hypothetical protein
VSSVNVRDEMKGHVLGAIRLERLGHHDRAAIGV